jgi:two-component system alkaline phosphatase synthesis response regulator PhoP
VIETRRVLVVDDDAGILELTQTVLAGAGYDVETAPSGGDALRVARESRFDLVLLDINMPEMDGWETLRILKADIDSATVPVVMFSIKSEVRDKVHGLQEGAVGYITKPFAVDDLLDGVRRVLESGPARASQDVKP